MKTNNLTQHQFSATLLAMTYDPPKDPAAERFDLLKRFVDELRKASGDGSLKRMAGTKPVWYEDNTHHAAHIRHYQRWINDPTHRDVDSGAHPLVHAAWRLLAIACMETGNYPHEPRPN